MHFDFKKAFRQAAAVVIMGLVGAGAGESLFRATHGDHEKGPTPQSTAAVQKYEGRLNVLSKAQQELETTTDEDAASKLETRKKIFMADVMLDSTMRDADVGKIATAFNAMADDGIAFRAPAVNPASLNERGVCLADVALTKDRVETAERVQDCMLVYAAKDQQGAKNAAELGGLVGAALAGSFLFGLGVGRKNKPSA